MKIRWLLQACIVVAVGMGFVSCTKAEIEQAMNRPAEIMLQSSPCQPAGIASTATPEFCVNVTEIQLLNRDTQADVSLTLVNRTGRRLFLVLPSSPYLTDSNGSKWDRHSVTGIGFIAPHNVPVPLEPNVETQVSFLFTNKGQAPSDQTTFSMRGEIAIMKVDSRGQASLLQTAVTRGFNIPGIRTPQQPPQSSAPIEQNRDTKLAQVSPQGVAPAIPKASASSQSTAPAAIAGASGNGKPNSQKSALPGVSGSLDQRASTVDTAVDDAPTNNNGSKSIGRGSSGPDVIGLRIGMTPDQTRAIVKSQVLVSDSLRKSYKETRQTLMITLPGGQSGGPVQNGKYLSSLFAFGKQDDLSSVTLRAFFAPVPGQEGIVSISRMIALPDSKRATFNVFEKSFLEKYGTPTLVTRNGNQGFMFSWSYDSNGTLNKPGFLKDYHPCTNAQGGINQEGSTVMQSVPFLEMLSAQCGDIFLFMNMSFASNYKGGETLVTHYVVEMTGFDATARAVKIAGGLIDKANADASAAAIKKGQQQKPEF